VTAIYGPLVKDILHALQTAIQARNVTEGINVPEVQLGLASNKRTLLREGIYILGADDRGATYPANYQRRTSLEVAVWCVTRDLQDLTGTERLIDLVGLVVDAVGADHTLGQPAKVNTTRVTDVEVREAADPSGILYEAIVSVEIVIQHSMK
jgi:hypothetical protein